LVVDFGGGTLDLSLIRTSSTLPQPPLGKGGSNSGFPLDKVELGGVKAEVLAKSDAYVGGVDIDAWIVEHYLRQVGSSQEEVKEIGWQNLLEVAERLKSSYLMRWRRRRVGLMMKILSLTNCS
jgi:molecular chaperone DnaK (HSP70)